MMTPSTPPPEETPNYTLKSSPPYRVPVLLAGCGGLLLLAYGAVQGWQRSLHGTNWAMRANGSIHFFTFGLAACAGSALLLVFMVSTSAWFARFETRQPARGRWVRLVLRGLMLSLGLIVLALCVLMPVA
jgi:hypothetical protein